MAMDLPSYKGSNRIRGFDSIGSGDRDTRRVWGSLIADTKPSTKVNPCHRGGSARTSGRTGDEGAKMSHRRTVDGSCLFHRLRGNLSPSSGKMKSNDPCRISLNLACRSGWLCFGPERDGRHVA